MTEWSPKSKWLESKDLEVRNFIASMHSIGHVYALDPEATR